MSGIASAEQRRLTHAVAAATDQQLAGIVALFDRMQDRREADRLLDAARPRLRRLRPPRPIALPRLLFLPLDGIIAEARSWRRQDGGLPRSALVPITGAVQQAMGAEATAIEAMVAGHSFADLPCVAAAGRRLWRGAAAVAADVAQPAAWAELGLTLPDFSHAMTLASGVWRHADALLDALLAAREGPPEPLVRRALSGAATEDPMMAEAMLATILLKAARPGSVAAAAAAFAPAGTPERVLDRWLASCEPEIGSDDPQAAARLAEDFAEALDDLEGCPAARRPERRQRVAALRREVGDACRTAYADAAAQLLVLPLARRGPPPDDAAMQGMEGSARALKRLEQAGRKLGGGAAYDIALRRIVDDFAAIRATPGANAADLARLTEILAGSEAALRLLDRS